MVQQVNGAFHFLLYKSLVLTLTFFKMVLKHSVETHTFEEGVFGVGTFGAYPHTFEEGVWCLPSHLRRRCLVQLDKMHEVQLPNGATS